MTVKLTRLDNSEIPPGQPVGAEFYRVNISDIQDFTMPDIKIYMVKTIVSGKLKDLDLKTHEGEVIANTRISLGEFVPDEWIVSALQRRYPQEPQEIAQEPIPEPGVSEYDLTEDFDVYDVVQYSLGSSYPEEIHSQIERDYPEIGTLAIEAQALRLEAEGLVLAARAKIMRAVRSVSCYARKAEDLHRV